MYGLWFWGELNGLDLGVDGWVSFERRCSVAGFRLVLGMFSVKKLGGSVFSIVFYYFFSVLVVRFG